MAPAKRASSKRKSGGTARKTGTTRRRSSGMSLGDYVFGFGLAAVGQLLGPAFDRQMRRLERLLFDDDNGPAPQRPPQEYEEDCYEILQVRPNASRAEIETAFRSRVVKLHPDKVAHMDPKFVHFAKVETQRLNKAREEALRRL